jgi:GH35 family endo-1,4-beta-xylanase
MKQYKSIIVAVAALAVVSCADDKFQSYQTADPNAKHSADYAYLNELDDLKSYTNPKASSTFKLGGAMEASDFMKKEQYYALGVSNFDEIVAGNAMKMASCVTDKGIFDYAAVTSFVNAAVDAGLDVYGHTLAWHSQQPVKWLNSLIADSIPEGSGDGKDYLCQFDFEDGVTIGGWGNDHVRTVKDGSYDGSKYMEILTVKSTNSWEAQGAIDFPSALEEGKTYTLHFWAKSSAPYSLSSNFQNPANYAGGGSFPNVDLTTEWQEYTVNATVSGENIKRFLFNYGNFIGTICIDDLSIYSAAAPKVKIPKQVVEYTFDDGQGLGGWGNGSTQGIVDGGHEGGKCWRVSNPSSVNPWECQSAIDFSNALEEGQTYYLHFWAKASQEGDVNAAYQNPSNYSGRGDYPSFHLTTEWTEYTLFTTITGDNCKRLCFNFGKQAGEIYLDDIEIYYMVEASGIPLSPERKKEKLTWAMEQWIKGMMEACEGKVEAWDVVNEAISGADLDGDGIYDLQHDPEGAKSDDFYWQDYLGDLDYVRTVVEFARQYGPKDIKLFINDYNLESDWDNNQKLKSLIAWIKRWEDDGVTKIDGIGTQMHISCYEDPAVQQRKKGAIENMLKLMVASGKLVRISELDMGYVDASGNKLNTADLTEEQHKEMAKLYNWIIQTYFDIVPADQQWGICQWCITDSPSNSGWRPNEPVGLWDQNFYRKHVYGGFATGLAGKPYEPGK